MTSALLVICALLQEPAPQQPERIVALVEELRSDGSQERTVAELDALGARAVPALLDAFESACAGSDVGFGERVLDVLGRLGPLAAPEAVPRLQGLHPKVGFCTTKYLATLSDLVLFRAPETVLDPRSSVLTLSREGGGTLDWFFWERLRRRSQVRADMPVQELVNKLSTRQAIDLEAALDLLTLHGPKAGVALPAIARLLERSDPRILGTEYRVRLRSRAAKAILAIGPHSEFAERARQVLSGEEDLPKTKQLPSRLQERIDTLMLELGKERTQRDAVDNLVAIGQPAMPAIAAATAADPAPLWCEGAVQVLGRIAPFTPDATPCLFALLPKVSAAQTATLLDALAVSAPLGWDELVFRYSMSGTGDVEVFGQTIRDRATTAEKNAIIEAMERVRVSLAFSPGASVEELAERLSDPQVDIRERALHLLLERQAAARSALPSIANAMEDKHPLGHVSRWLEEGGMSSQHVDRTAKLQTLAAEVILAVAEPGDPLVERAKGVVHRGKR